MPEQDIVAELDAWIATCNEVWGRDCSIPKRARDEIVALRAMREEHIRMLSANNREVRVEALEEAAQACEARANSTGQQDAYATLDVVAYKGACGGCAFDIRALKDKPR